MESYYYIKNARMDYEYLLKKFSDYSLIQTNWNNNFVYLSRYDDEQLLELYNKYGLARFAKENDEIKIFLKVLRWSHEILLYSKQKEYTRIESATNIIEYCKSEKVTVNCRQHAIVLTEALLSMGYEARIVCCLPIDVLPYDNHAITAVYSHRLSKWIALDPSRNCYFLNEEGEILSVSEIRQSLIRDEKIHFKYLHRFAMMDSDSKLVQFDDAWYLDYLYKNFFRFYCSKINGTTARIPQYFYHLVPTGYADVNNERVYHYENFSSKTIVNTDNLEMFWAKPTCKTRSKRNELQTIHI